MLLIGPPGSGKGTQAERISNQLGIIAISTGDIFRYNVKSRTRLGLEAKKYVDQGDFVPDRVTNNMIRDRLTQNDIASGFLLDGYPRTVAQAMFLDQILADKNQKLDVVLQITAEEDELVSRLLKRAAAEGRADDTHTIIRHRLNLYQYQTKAVVSHYEQQGLLASVDGTGAVEKITESLIEAATFGRDRRTVGTE